MMTSLLKAMVGSMALVISSAKSLLATDLKMGTLLVMSRPLNCLISRRSMGVTISRISVSLYSLPFACCRWK